MAAAATHIPPSPDATAMLAFLQAATAVFASVWSQHQSLAEEDDDAKKKPKLDCCSSSTAAHTSHLRVAVAAMEQADEVDVPASLLRECIKIGKDVGLRLDRLENSTKEASFTWSLVDLAVLAERLDSLVQRAHYHEKLPFPAEQLRQLERQLAVRFAPHAPPGDEFYNGEHKVDTERKAKEPHSEFKKLAQGLRKDVHPANRPREVAPDILHDFILEGLAYKSMRDREDEVAEAYASTFDWVFTEKGEEEEGGRGGSMKHSLKNWLSTSETGPIYWITGKPGSGKSTFIRYLFQHAATTKCLEAWGGEAPVLVAGFFFWTSGSREQRSQTGLLRSLLHQFLSAHPDYTAIAFPALWKRLRTMPTKERVQLRLEWTVEELLPAFRAFIDAASAEMRICLFVDGMDEFEGDHAMMIDLFRGLATGSGSGDSVKMCLSSRPWTVFRDAFAFAVPNLRLQELTYGDMRQYVSETMAQDGEMSVILGRDAAKGSRFVDALIDRADGVFLWVRLAVERVLERFVGEDGMDGLTQLLATLPGDLDALFTKLLFEDQTTQELGQSAALYSLMRAREEVADFVRNDDANSLTVWDIAFALDKEDDQMILDKVPVEEAPDEYIQKRGEATINTIKHRFSGLLDFHIRSREGNLRLSRSKPQKNGHSMRDRARSRVVYIHRTVRDWLVSGSGIHDKLLKPLPADFDPNLRLLRSYVLQMKRPLVFIEHHRMLDDWWPGITLALTHARHVTSDPKHLQRMFVNELDATIAWWWAAKPHDPYDHWARNAFGSFEMRMKAPPIWQPFLCLAVKFGLRAYVAAELAARQQDENDLSEEMRALQVDDAVPLLAYATEHLCSRKRTIYPLSDPGLVGDLLRTRMRRVNPGPDHGYRDFATRAEMTPWLAVLRHLRDARRRRWIKRYDVDDDGTRRWARVVRLFLEVGGADPHAVVKEDCWDSEITAEGVMELLDDTYDDVEIQGLKDMLRELRQQTKKQPAV